MYIIAQICAICQYSLLIELEEVLEGALLARSRILVIVSRNTEQKNSRTNNKEKEERHFKDWVV